MFKMLTLCSSAEIIVITTGIGTHGFLPAAGSFETTPLGVSLPQVSKTQTLSCARWKALLDGLGLSNVYASKIIRIEIMALKPNPRITCGTTIGNI